MQRLDLPKIEQVILDDQTYLRVGDIIQTGCDRVGDVDVPILAAIESQTDPLLNLYNFSDAHYFGNVLVGDNINQVEAAAQQAAIAEAKHRAAQNTVQQLEANLRHVEAQPVNHQQQVKPQPVENPEHYYNVLAKRTDQYNDHVNVLVLLYEHHTKKTTWCRRVFKLDQAQTLENFQRNIQVHQTVKGVVTNNGWIKYLYPSRR